MSNRGGKRPGAGRPKNRYDDERVLLARKARKHSTAAIKALVDNLKDTNGSVRNKAAEELLNRGFGKSPQEIVLEEGTEDAQVESRGISALLGIATDAIDAGDEAPDEVPSKD